MRHHQGVQLVDVFILHTDHGLELLHIDFLDVITTHILAIEAGKMQLFTGNYSACERARAERLANDLALAAKQKREAAHLQSYIDRFRAKASKARQAQSRIKMLAKMGDIIAAHIDTPFSFSFPEPTGFSDPLLLIDDAKVGYGQRREFAEHCSAPPEPAANGQLIVNPTPGPTPRSSGLPLPG